MTTLIHINQCNKHQQNAKKNKDIEKRCQIQVIFELKLFWIQKLMELRKKMLNANSLVALTILNTKIGEIESKIPSYTKYFTT